MIKKLILKFFILLYLVLFLVASGICIFAAIEVKDFTGVAKAQSEFVLFPITPFLLVSLVNSIRKIYKKIFKQEPIFKLPTNIFEWINYINLWGPFIDIILVAGIIY